MLVFCTISTMCKNDWPVLKWTLAYPRIIVRQDFLAACCQHRLLWLHITENEQSEVMVFLTYMNIWVVGYICSKCCIDLSHYVPPKLLVLEPHLNRLFCASLYVHDHAKNSNPVTSFWHPASLIIGKISLHPNTVFVSTGEDLLAPIWTVTMETIHGY